MSSPVVISSIPIATMSFAQLTSASKVVVGLGANLGEPIRTLAQAALEVSGLVGGDLRVAALYRSAPIGPAQPDFFNSAVAIDWRDPLDGLLARLQEIEGRFGRERNLRWGPRTLDLDVLWADGRTSMTPELRVPHPELCLRAFALRPLLDLFPEAVVPPAATLCSAFLPKVHSQRIERVAGPEWVHETLPM